ncbi:DUF1929 domain-containing protein [Venturia nashicola]|uniref:DUF1929 domain-containing protein n=1 Tax=Venturia nashicola TaxID=86259 RepID=A0A4Z1NS97_9PEZI|nr:DUF1929 domain-containing protein [Venturia nashicola]
MSGTTQGGNNNDTQVLDNNTFTSVDRTGQIKDLYPRVHIASTQIAYSISLAFIYFLDLKTPSPRSWQPIATRADAGNDPERSLHDYGCSVMYDKDKVVYIGGGKPGTAETDTLDLGLSDPTKIKWQASDPMMFRRRQHNATILPDGTVLVTGGTRGDGRPVGGDVAFNDLRSGRPVHVAELWNPSNVPGKQWTRMASEQIDRCYHSTAILLPDGRVLSAGGGEFQLNNPNSGQNPEKVPNPDADSHLDAQVFSPPYLFLEGARPVINSISTEAIVCNTKFEIGTELPEQITKINLIGLSSVTHSMNTGQRLVPLKDFVRKTKSLIVSAPPDTKSCPPGYYLLFIINQKGQPSIGKIVQIVPSSDDMANALLINTQLIAKNISPPTPQMMRKTVRATANGTRVEIGITPTCPYGLSACWGGAYEALSNLPGVEHVDPIAHMSGSTASVFLEDNRLPDLELWTRIFKAFVRDTYILRGFEAVITGIPEIQDKTLVLRGEGMRSEISLARLGSKAKVQWDPRTRLPQIPTDEEMAAYDGLFQSAVLGIVEPVSISGPLSQSDDLRYTLQVRLVQ